MFARFSGEQRLSISVSSRGQTTIQASSSSYLLFAQWLLRRQQTTTAFARQTDGRANHLSRSLLPFGRSSVRRPTSVRDKCVDKRPISSFDGERERERESLHQLGEASRRSVDFRRRREQSTGRVGAQFTYLRAASDRTSDCLSRFSSAGRKSSSGQRV